MKQTTGTECTEQKETLSSSFNNTSDSFIQEQAAYQLIPLPEKTLGGSECNYITVESLKNECQNHSIFRETKEDTLLSGTCTLVPKCHYHDAEEEKQSNRMVDNEGKYQDCNRIGRLATKEQQVDTSTSRLVGGSGSGLASKTSWSQSEDTVQVTIHVAGVEQYKCHFLSSHLVFK